MRSRSYESTKVCKPLCTLVRRMEIPQSDSEHCFDDKISTEGTQRRTYCEAVLLKRTKLGELNMYHSFRMKEGRNLLIFSELPRICWNGLRFEICCRESREIETRSKYWIWGLETIKFSPEILSDIHACCGTMHCEFYKKKKSGEWERFECLKNQSTVVKSRLSLSAMSNYCQGVYVMRWGDGEPINLHRIAIQTEESRESRKWRKNRAPCFLLPNDEPAHGSQTMNFTMFLHIS